MTPPAARAEALEPCPMDAAPKDGTPILIFGEIDDGEHGAAPGWVIAFWVSGEDASGSFGEEGGWCLSHRKARDTASVENAQYWLPLPPNLDAQAQLIEEAREVVTNAARRFRFYEREHNEKAEMAPANSRARDDRGAKAATNRKAAEECEAFLATLPAKGGAT